MGRKHRKESIASKSFEDHFNWPWKLEIDIGVKFEMPRVCFLSSQSRRYFPDDPGHSRHGIEYSMNCHPGDTPNPTYFPSEDRLQKPISLLGYGIGGLSALRFPKELNDTSSDLNPYSNGRQPREKLKDRWLRKNEEQDQCEHEPAIGFGTSNKVPRFEKLSKGQIVGVGNYELRNRNLCKKIPITTGFGRRPVQIIPPTATQCSYDIENHCTECDINPKSKDYYRSCRQISIPKHRSFGSLIESENNPMQSPKYCILCRKCYCRIMREGHSFWKKVDLVTRFQKTRHCINIHEHNDLPVFTHKVHCKYSRNLTRKEALMAKYFDDSCEKSIKEVVDHTKKAKHRWGLAV